MSVILEKEQNSLRCYRFTYVVLVWSQFQSFWIFAEVRLKYCLLDKQWQGNEFLDKAQCDFLKSNKIKEKQPDAQVLFQSLTSWSIKQRNPTFTSVPSPNTLWTVGYQQPPLVHLLSKVMLISIITDSVSVMFKALGFIHSAGVSSGLSCTWGPGEILLHSSWFFPHPVEV